VIWWREGLNLRVVDRRSSVDPDALPVLVVEEVETVTSA
jgi:hypothetical protein